MSVDGTVSYLLADHLGSTSTVVNAMDDPVSQKYYPFGRTRSGSVPTDKQFTGHQKEGSLYFMQARFYDPALGRFLSPDSIVPDPSNPQSLNRYSYVLNNPLRYTDPTGHCVGGFGWACNTADLVVDQAEDAVTLVKVLSGYAAAETVGVLEPRVKDAAAASRWVGRGTWAGTRATGAFIADESRDVRFYARNLRRHPGSVIQNTVTLAIALTSAGDRRQISDDFAFYFDCGGSCWAINRYLLRRNPPAYTPGETAFSTLPFSEVFLETIVHEQQHGIQSDAAGPLYYVGLYWEYRTVGYDNSIFERDARAAGNAGRTHSPPRIGRWCIFGEC